MTARLSPLSLSLSSPHACACSQDEVVERLRRSGREPPSWPWSLLGDGLAPGERAQLADLKERKGELKREIAQMGR